MKRSRLLLLVMLFWLAGTAWLPQIKAADGPVVPASVEERRLRVSIQEELDQTRQKAEELRLKEIELKTLAEEVDKKLAAMTKVRSELTALLEQKNEVESKKVKELSKMYEKMEPAKAAQLLVSLEEELAVGILGGIKKKTAGKILNAMNKEKAVQLSDAYSSLSPK